MNIKTIVETFFKMEEEMDLFNKTIEDIHFWDLIRFRVVNQIAQQKGVYGQAHARLENNLKYYVHKITNAFKNILIKNPFFVAKYDILFWGHSRRKLLEDGLWWDIYCDPVMEYIIQDNKSILFENSYLNSHLTPAKTSHIKYFDVAFFLEAVRRNLELKLFPKKDSHFLILKDIQMNIMIIFGVYIDLNELVAATLSVRKNMLPFYLFVLDRVRPKVVVVLVSYYNKILIEACKKKSIPVVEFQHGTISRYHTGYSFPGSLTIKNTFPDYIFTFGEYWTNLVDLPISKKRVFSVGYPFFEMETAKYKNTPKKNQVVFVSQGTIGAEMSKFAVELSAIHNIQIDIIYKLHPGEYDRWMKDYPWLVTANIRVIDNDSVPLYQLLAQSRILVGVYSTVVYEGLGMGLRTILLNLPGVEYMEELIESKEVSVVDSVDEFLQILENPVSSTAANAEKFFKPNSLENIALALDVILKEREEG